MTTHLLPVLPAGWTWQQHPASVAFVVASNGREHSKPLGVNDKRSLRQFAERFGRVQLRRTRIAEQGYSAEECEQYTRPKCTEITHVVTITKLHPDPECHP